MSLEVKLEEEDKALLLLSSLPQSYDHLETTIMYRNETLELKDARQMLQNNELMKMTNSTKEPQDWLLRSRGGDHRVEGPRRVPKLLMKILIATTANNQGTY